MSEEVLGHSEHTPELLCCLEGVTQSQFPCCKMSYYVLRVDAIICMSGNEHTSCQKELSMLRYCTDLGSGSIVNVGIMSAVRCNGRTTARLPRLQLCDFGLSVDFTGPQFPLL